MHEVVNPNDMWMSQLERAPGLPLQIVESRAILQHQVRQKLQRNLALQLFIARQPDNAHPPAPKDFDQRVTAEKLLPGPILTQRRLRASTQIVSRSHFHSSSTKRRSSLLAAIASG